MYLSFQMIREVRKQSAMQSNLWSCTAMALTNQETFGETASEIKCAAWLRLTDLLFY